LVHLFIDLSDLSLKLLHLAIELSNLVFELFLNLAVDLYNLAHDRALDFLYLTLRPQVVLGHVVFQILDALSDGRHNTFPLRFLFIVDRSNDVKVFLLREHVERISKSNPVHVADVHLRFSFDCVEHAFFHNSGESVSKNSDQCVEHYHLGDEGSKQEYNPHRNLDGL
jgi:hypothetical protein